VSVRTGVTGRVLGLSAAGGAALWVALFLLRGVPDLRDVAWAEAVLQLGALVVVPLGLRLVAETRSAAERRLAAWSALGQPLGALALVLSFGLAEGELAGALALPWLAVTLLVGLRGVVRFLSRPGRRDPAELAVDAALAFLAVGGGWTLLARAGIRPLGFSAAIVLLTGIHFHYAGFALPLATGLAARRRSGGPARAAAWGVILGVPAVAVGITASQLGAMPGVEAAAAVWMAAAGLLAAWLHLALALRPGAPGAARLLWLVAGAALVFGMPFAALYGLRGAHALPLDLPTMRALHGTVLALGFGVAASLGWTLAARRNGLAELPDELERERGPMDSATTDDPRRRRPAPESRLPRFLRLLTAIHAVGALACLVMAAGSALSPGFRDALVVSGGSALMVELFGGWTWAFLLFVGAVLATLAGASWRVRPWAWHLTLIVYGIGVLGSLWQVSLGIPQGWLSGAVNGAVVAYAARPKVRRAYLGA